MPQATDMLQSATTDSSPKWFTEVELNLRDRWTESTIEYTPTLSYDDSAYTRIEIETNQTEFTPAPTPGA